MEGAAELEYVLIEDDMDEEMYREQDMAHTYDPNQPSTSEVSKGGRLRANEAGRAPPGANMHQSFKDPGSCQSSGKPSTSSVYKKPEAPPEQPSPAVTKRGSTSDRVLSREGERAVLPAAPELRQSLKITVQSEQRTGVAVHRRIRSGFVTRSSIQPNNCKSPSTDSTTSLAQLRDKLNVLSPLKYYKVPTKIASTPELPILHELDEQEDLSNSLKSTNKRVGVSLKWKLEYRSDPETQAKTVKEKTSRLSPVVEEHSASLLLVASLINRDQSVIDEAFQKLYKNNPNVDLADLLVAEALEHGQGKDSAEISGNVTQDSDVVENTPVEKAVRHKLSSKSNAKSIAKDTVIDESELEVIEDTPCFVYDRKERVRPDSTKANKSKEIVTIDTQHVNENNTVSPTLAKKINASSSEASDDECILIENNFMAKGQNVNDLFFEADVIDCVSSIIDKVCDNLDKYAEIVAETERQMDQLELDENVNISSDIFKTSKDNLKSDKDISYEHNPKDTKKYLLKFKQSKKVAQKMNTRKQTANNYKDLNDIENRNVLAESTNTETLSRVKRKLYSPKDDENESNEIPNSRIRVQRRQSNVNESPIATCYRELENARKSHSKVPNKSRASTQAKKARYTMYNTGEDPSFQGRKCTSSSSIASITTMSRRERPVKPVNYVSSNCSWRSSSEDDDFENNRVVKPKAAKKIKPRSRKVEKTSKTQPVLSPKTRKYNEMFDKIKDNVLYNDEKITLVEKRYGEKDLSRYNLSSGSEDGDFKKNRIQVHKRNSSFSLHSSGTKRRRSMRPINYSEHYSSDDEGKKTQKPNGKTVKRKQTKPRNRKANKIPKLNLVDERMRVAQQETLETSFIKEIADANVEEPEPLIQQAPALEVMPPDKLNDDVTEDVESENKTQTPVKLDISKIKKETKSKKYEKVTRSTVTKKGKENIKNIPKERDSAPVSPLPNLVVESERTRKYDLTSSMETNLLQKFKKIYTDVHDISENNTQNLLLNPHDNDMTVLDPIEIVETAIVSDVLSEISIATGSYSPITAHNDLNESPPNDELLHEDFQHRDVHNEVMSESMTEFLDIMRNNLQVSKLASQTSPVIPITRMSTKESARSVCVKRMSSRESTNKSISHAQSYKSIESKKPIGTPKSNVFVVISRMSSEEIKTHLTPTRTNKTSDTGTPKSKASVVRTRMSSEEIKKHCDTQTSPKIVLERISSDEINRWLPMPETKDKAVEKPKKYITRQSCQLTDTKTPPAKVIQKKIKLKISPVKLKFDFVDLKRAPSATRSTKSHAATNKEALKTDSIKSSIPKAQSNAQSLARHSQETIKSATRFKPDKTPASVLDPCDTNKSIASVQAWLKENATPSSPSAADNHAVKEMLRQVLEAVQTTLAEIHGATSERFIAEFLKDHEDITSLEEEMQHMQMRLNRILEKTSELKKNRKDRVCEVIRADAEQKALMVRLLQEDIQRVLDQRK